MIYNSFTQAEIKPSFAYAHVADHLTIGCWRDELLTLIIHRDGVFWRGSFNANDLQTWTNQSESTVNVYAAKLLKALSDHREIDPLFTIEVKHSSLELLWSKEVKPGIGITFGNFCLSLTAEVNQTLTDLVELLFSELTQARSECTRLNSENNALQECTNTAVQVRLLENSSYIQASANYSAIKQRSEYPSQYNTGCRKYGRTSQTDTEAHLRLAFFQSG
ncbi:hypothetical protein AHF37_07546 [Paragonimus kellicotti]|nr:hypothetical protein AHF37_07546 [Paragonimus kellicotti]